MKWKTEEKEKKTHFTRFAAELRRSRGIVHTSVASMYYVRTYVRPWVHANLDLVG